MSFVRIDPGIQLTNEDDFENCYRLKVPVSVIHKETDQTKVTGTIEEFSDTSLTIDGTVYLLEEYDFFTVSVD